MDKHKKFNRAKKPASIDGIISDSPQLGRPISRVYQPGFGQNTSDLGAYIRRTDGFHPARSSGGSLGQSAEQAEAEALLDEPIILDHIDDNTKKRRQLAPKKHRRRKALKKVALTFGVILIVAGAYLGLKFYLAQKKILAGGGQAPAVCSNDISASLLKGEGDGRVNILLLGIGGPGHDGPDLTDTIMLVSIDTVNNKVAMLSIPRDLWVQIPGDGSQKINAAFAYGKQGELSKSEKVKTRSGLKLLDKTIAPVLGIPVHYHTVVNFKAFKQTVDALGGISVNVPETLNDPTIAWENHYNSVIAAKGVQKFDGLQALLYAKSRETSPRGDFDRSERQRRVLVAIKEKTFSVGTFSNPVKISQLLTSLSSNIYTDFDSTSIKCIYKKMSEIPSTSINSFDLVTAPHDFVASANIPGISALAPKAGAYDYSAINGYIRNVLRDSFIAKENSSVAVYNATSVNGLAASKADYLKSYGYSITTVANAPKASNPSTTIVVDLTKGTAKYTRHYLEGRFGVTARDSMPAGSGITPPAGTNFVIILGTDAANSR
jgi:LCP family protein required for cell wall assembly